MGIGSGLGSQLMVGVETTYGTGVTPTVAYEITDEDLQFKNNKKLSVGLRAGGLTGFARRYVTTDVEGTGSVTMDVPSRGFGKFLRALCGQGSSAQQGATAAYLESFSFADIAGQSLTVQKGAPRTSGTSDPLTFTGCKVTGIDFGCKVGDVLTSKIMLDAQNMTSATALATPTYSPLVNVFSFAGGALSINGTPELNIKEVALSIARPLNTKRLYLGANGLKGEPLLNDNKAFITGTLTCDYTDTLLTSAYYANTDLLSTVITFQTPTVIATGFPEQLQFTLNDIRLDGDTPQIKGPDILEIVVPFVALYDTSSGLGAITYQTADTAI